MGFAGRLPSVRPGRGQNILSRKLYEEERVSGVVIRHSEPEDRGAVHLVYSSPKAMAGTLGLPFSPNRSWHEKLAEDREGNPSPVACARDEVVGHLALSVYANARTRHSGHFGIAVRDDWRGRGVGTALVGAALDLGENWPNLSRVELTVYTDNAAGVALYEKFGFEIEGTHRRFAFRDGEYVDAHVMARLR
jgi:L-phenylalanine/L-methionine N-acetyltransferase